MMLKFYLVKDKFVTFHSDYHDFEDPYTKTALITSSVVPKYDCCAEVKQFLEALTNSQNPIDYSLELMLGNFSTNHENYRGPYYDQLVIAYLADRENGILQKIHRRFPDAEVKISIDGAGNHSEELVCQKFSFESLKLQQRSGRLSFSFVQSDRTQVRLRRPWYTLGSFSGQLTISVRIPSHECRKISIESPLIPQLHNLNLKILEEGLGSDVVITAGNGAQIPAHKSFLSAQSPVLKAMLQSGMKEGMTGHVEMDDMTEEAVKAFLAYLYLWDIREAVKSCQIAFELFQAGHKYHVRSLEELMKDILLDMRREEYTIEVGLKLFCFVRCMEGAADLKWKAVNVLKSRIGELMGQDLYQNLFKKDPATAMELCNCFAQIN